ncbi:MAG TPA: hypothetical protein VF711_13885 [Acidimicrobiales bacterium]
MGEAGIVVIDTEEESEHMARLGQTSWAREDYVDLVHQVSDDRVALPKERRPADVLRPRSKRTPAPVSCRRRMKPPPIRDQSSRAAGHSYVDPNWTKSEVSVREGR